MPVIVDMMQKPWDNVLGSLLAPSYNCPIVRMVNLDSRREHRFFLKQFDYRLQQLQLFVGHLIRMLWAGDAITLPVTEALAADGRRINFATTNAVTITTIETIWNLGLGNWMPDRHRGHRIVERLLAQRSDNRQYGEHGRYMEGAFSTYHPSRRSG